MEVCMSNYKADDKANYRDMYYHLAGRTATAVETLEATISVLESTVTMLESAVNVLGTTAAGFAEIKEGLKNAQQTTEEMFIHIEDDVK